MVKIKNIFVSFVGIDLITPGKDYRSRRIRNLILLTAKKFLLWSYNPTRIHRNYEIFYGHFQEEEYTESTFLNLNEQKIPNSKK